MNFAWPEVLWLLLLAPLLAAFYIWLLRRRQPAVVAYSDGALVKKAMGNGHRWRRHIPPLLVLCSLIVLVIGTSRPSAIVPLASMRQTIILAVDVSISMDATDVEPNRLSAAQLAAKAFVQEAPANLRIGLVTFGGSAAEVQAPTDNRADLLAAIDRFNLQRGTATGSALYTALASLLPESGLELQAMNLGSKGLQDRRPAVLDRPRAPKETSATPVMPGSYTSGAIILMSDGQSTMGPKPLDAARVAAEHGVRVFTIGFGTKEGATVRVMGMSIFVRLDEATLQGIADITKGAYLHAATGAELKQAYQDLTTRLIVERKEVELSFIFVAFALLLLLMGLGLSLYWFPRVTGATPWRDQRPVSP
ncbi:MAG: VWA domain-containing protein [Casimicrobiaceae bacterium]